MLADRFGCVQVASTTLFKPRLRPTLGRVVATTPAGAFAVDMAFGFALAFAAPLAVSACWEVRCCWGTSAPLCLCQQATSCSVAPRHAAQCLLASAMIMISLSNDRGQRKPRKHGKIPLLAPERVRVARAPLVACLERRSAHGRLAVTARPGCCQSVMVFSAHRHACAPGSCARTTGRWRAWARSGRVWPGLRTRAAWPCWLHAGRTAAAPAAERGPARSRPGVTRGVCEATTGLQGRAADPGGAGTHACPAMGVQGSGVRFGIVGPGIAQGAPEEASAAVNGAECAGRGGPRPCKAVNGHLSSAHARNSQAAALS